MACAPERPVFECSAWTDCGEGGACEPGTGACSVVDTSCEGGRRFSALAPGASAGQCVPLLANAGRGELCVKQTDTPIAETSNCGKLRQCLDDRCISVSQLSSRRELSCGVCSNRTKTDGFLLFCWGASEIYNPFAPTWLNVTAVDCTAPGPRCPAGCETCPAEPCPVACRGDLHTRRASVGANHACFFNGRAHCFGSNLANQIGTTPASLVDLSPLAKAYDVVAAGWDHTCAREPGSSLVECWGSNASGQLDGTPEATMTPIPRVTTPFPVMGGTSVAIPERLAAGKTFTCAASSTRVTCWGTTAWPAGEVMGLGDGPITALDVGDGHACVVKGGRAVCWGQNTSGQAAPGDPAALVGPTDVLPGVEVEAIATGEAHACAVTVRGAVTCWGASDRGQLGPGGEGPGPVDVAASAPAVGPIAAGRSQTCAVHADDRVRCWGEVLVLDGTPYDVVEHVPIGPPGMPQEACFDRDPLPD